MLMMSDNEDMVDTIVHNGEMGDWRHFLHMSYRILQFREESVW